MPSRVASAVPGSPAPCTRLPSFEERLEAMAAAAAEHPALGQVTRAPQGSPQKCAGSRCGATKNVGQALGLRKGWLALSPCWLRGSHCCHFAAECHSEDTVGMMSENSQGRPSNPFISQYDATHIGCGCRCRGGTQVFFCVCFPFWQKLRFFCVAFFPGSMLSPPPAD